jgi:hypothetical protein
VTNEPFSDDAERGFLYTFAENNYWNYGRFLGNIHYDDRWISGHFYGCQTSQESTPS